MKSTYSYILTFFISAILMVLFNNCQELGMVDPTKSHNNSSTSDSSSILKQIEVLAKLSSSAGKDCSLSDANLELVIKNASENIKICQEFKLTAPSRDGETYVCDDDNKFITPKSPWLRNDKTGTWSVKVNLRNHKSYVPGVYKLAVKDTDGQVVYSPEATILRKGYDSCLANATPAKVPTPSTINADPGYGTGLWLPSAVHQILVADQSDINGVAKASIVPGCINGGSLLANADCRKSTTFSGNLSNGQAVNLSLTQGQVLSLRYRVNKNAEVKINTGGFQLTNILGGSVSYRTTISLSEKPGDFNVSSNCSSTSNRIPKIETGQGQCRIKQEKQIYYLNIRVDTTCRECIFVVSEESDELY